MKDFLTKFLSFNSWQYKLFRTVIQGIFGVIIANLDVIIGSFVIDPVWKGIVVAMVMAILSPIMAILGEKNNGTISELQS